MTTPDRTENLIEFQGPMELEDPAPFRAIQAMPDWIKQMDPLRMGPGNTPVDTIKRCAPFTEAMTCGYIIPLRRTVKFIRRDDGGVQFDTAGDNDVVSGQAPSEYQGSPFERAAVVKFKNSWIIKTPPGYSTLFLPLLNRVDFPFMILAGLVETDVYYKEVYFPSICLMHPGTELVLEKGTPLAQIVPIKREVWQSKTANWDMKRRLETEVDFRIDPHKYKQDLWVKKEYR